MPPLIPIIIGSLIATSGIGGIILGGLTALTIGITGLGASLILGGLSRLMLPKPPSLAAFIQEARGRTITARQPVTPWRVILGKIRVGGVMTFLHVTGTNKEFLHMVITISGHEVEEIGLMYFDGVLVPVDGSGNATGFFLNHVHREINLGTDTQAAFPGLLADAPTKWTANHRQLGRAGVYVRLKFNPDKFPGSIPNITFDVKGKLLYDPRTQSSIAAAPTGADRTANVVTITTTAAHGLAVNDRARVDGVTDSSFDGDFPVATVPSATTFTYAQTAANATSGSGTVGLVAWSENAALCFSEYLLDTDYGVGVPLPKIDNSAWVAAANLAEEQVALNAGGFEDRYTCNGSFLVSERPREIMLAVLTAMGGTAVYSGGFWFIYGAAFRSPTLSFDEGDLRGPLRVQSRTGRGQLFNAVKGLYVSAANNWQPSDFPPVTNATFESEDGGKRIYRDIELPYTISAATAQRLAKIELERARRQKTVEVRFGPTAFQAQPPDVIQLSVARFGWTNKTFEVLNEKLMLEQDEDGTPRPEIALTLRETDVNVYGFSAEDAPPTAPGDPDLPDLSVAAPPTALVLSSFSITRTDGIRVTFLNASWTAPADEFVTAGGMIEIEYKKNSSGTWLPVSPVPGNETEQLIPNVDDDVAYDVRIRSVNVALVKSAFVQQLNFTVTGIAASILFEDRFVENSGFEQGDKRWTKGTGWVIVEEQPFKGTWAAKHTGATVSVLRNSARVPVAQGDRVLAVGYGKKTAGGGAVQVRISWRDSADAELSVVAGNNLTSSTYAESRVLGIAPANAVAAVLEFSTPGVDAASIFFVDFSAAGLMPIVVEGVGNASYRPLTNPLTAADVGTTATITVANFTMRIAGLSDVSVTGNSTDLTGKPFDTVHYVFYDDPTIAGGAVTFGASTTREDALSGGGRFFIGTIRTPVDGGADTVGLGDGGAAAQISATGLTVRPTENVIAGSVGFSNPDNAQDGVLASFARGFDADTDNQPKQTKWFAFQVPNLGIGIQEITLKIDWETIKVGAGVVVMRLRYSKDGGVSWITEISTNLTRARETRSISLGGLDISQLQVEALSDWITGGSTSGEVKVYDIFVDVVNLGA